MDSGRLRPEDDGGGEGKDGERGPCARAGASHGPATEGEAGNAASSAGASEGPGTRRSAEGAWLTWPMRAVMACSSVDIMAPGNCGEPGTDEGRAETSRGQAARAPRPAEADHVGGQCEDSGAMEVESHGQHHTASATEADAGRVPRSRVAPRSRAVGRLRARRAKCALRGPRPTGAASREVGPGAAAARCRASGRAGCGLRGVRQEAAFAERHCDAGDGDDGEEGHLEAGLEERAWRPDEDDERGGTEGVQVVALAREQAGAGRRPSSAARAARGRRSR